jgi:hypothetical protein
MKTRFAGGLLAVLALGSALLGRAGAQSSTPAPLPAPTPIVVPTLPPADPTTQAIIRAASGLITGIIMRERAQAANTTRGTVSYFRRFDMQVQTGTNSYRTVRLHPGTVINPRGATPGAGTAVDVGGHGAADGALDADTITVLH